MSYSILREISKTDFRLMMADLETLCDTGLIIAGTQSSSGKTLVNAMVLCALRQRGIVVQPFKTGPDYIDTAYSSRYAGRPSYNLDFWLMERDSIESLTQEKTRETFGVAEGVMGLFDGIAPESDEGSTYTLAKLLKWPVFLVIPAAKQGRSIRATLRGFLEEAGEGVIQGIIFNKVSGSSHGEYLKRAVADMGVPVVGAISLMSDIEWPERHLGLQASQEWVPTSAERLATEAERYLDLDQMLQIAAGVNLPKSKLCPSISVKPWAKGKRLAIAHDAAFHFYYQGNLDALREWGFDWVEFSPLEDKELPPGVDGIILGGGFPEVYAEALSGNGSMKASIRRAAESGMPCYAECGGFMYLCETIVQRDGEESPMLGIVPGKIHMTERLQNFGYSECLPAGNSTGFRAHEFHYSYWDAEASHANLWTVKKHSRSKTRLEGYGTSNLHASYLHLYFPSAQPLFQKLFGALTDALS